MKKTCDELVLASVDQRRGAERSHAAAVQQNARGGEHAGLQRQILIANFASTVKVRELESTAGLMAVTVP